MRALTLSAGGAARAIGMVLLILDGLLAGIGTVPAGHYVDKMPKSEFAILEAPPRAPVIEHGRSTVTFRGTLRMDHPFACELMLFVNGNAVHNPPAELRFQRVGMRPRESHGTMPPMCEPGMFFFTCELDLRMLGAVAGDFIELHLCVTKLAGDDCGKTEVYTRGTLVFAPGNANGCRIHPVRKDAPPFK